MSLALLVVTAVRIEGRTKAEVAREYGVSWRWAHELVSRYDAEGETGLTWREGWGWLGEASIGRQRPPLCWRVGACIEHFPIAQGGAELDGERKRGVPRAARRAFRGLNKDHDRNPALILLKNDPLHLAIGGRLATSAGDLGGLNGDPARLQIWRVARVDDKPRVSPPLCLKLERLLRICGRGEADA